MKIKAMVIQAFNYGKNAYSNGKPPNVMTDPEIKAAWVVRGKGDPATELERHAVDLGWRHQQIDKIYRRLMKEAEAYNEKKPDPKKEPG